MLKNVKARYAVILAALAKLQESPEPVPKMDLKSFEIWDTEAYAYALHLVLGAIAETYSHSDNIVDGLYAWAAFGLGLTFCDCSCKNPGYTVGRGYHISAEDDSDDYEIACDHRMLVTQSGLASVGVYSYDYEESTSYVGDVGYSGVLNGTQTVLLRLNGGEPNLTLYVPEDLLKYLLLTQGYMDTNYDPEDDEEEEDDEDDDSI